jgi:parallel beta-helix repeat protein
LGAVWALAVVLPAQAGTTKVEPGESVQAAIDAAQPGDVVVLKAGVHAGGLTIPEGLDGLTLKGQGNAIVDAAGLDTGILVQADDVTLTSLLLRHALAMGVQAEGVSGLTLERLELIGCEGGVFVGGDGAHVVNCLLWGCDGGIQIEGDDAVVERSEVVQDRTGGIQVTGERARVERCRVAVGASNPAIGVTGGQAVVSRNRVEDVSRRTVSVDGDDALVERNVAGGANNEGMHVSGDRAHVSRNKVSDVRASEEGIYVSSTEGAVVERNQLDHCLGTGLSLHTGGALIERNTVRDCGVRAVGIYVGGSANVVSKNTVKRCYSTGVSIAGSDNEVLGNRLKDNSDNGLLIGGSGSAGGTLVERNRIQGNQGEGLENRGQDTTFLDNRFSKNRADVANDGKAGATLVDGGGNQYEGEIGQPEIDP